MNRIRLTAVQTDVLISELLIIRKSDPSLNLIVLSQDGYGDSDDVTSVQILLRQPESEAEHRSIDTDGDQLDSFIDVYGD